MSTQDELRNEARRLYFESWGKKSYEDLHTEMFTECKALDISREIFRINIYNPIQNEYETGINALIEAVAKDLKETTEAISRERLWRIYTSQAKDIYLDETAFYQIILAKAQKIAEKYRAEEEQKETPIETTNATYETMAEPIDSNNTVALQPKGKAKNRYSRLIGIFLLYTLAYIGYLLLAGISGIVVSTLLTVALFVFIIVTIVHSFKFPRNQSDLENNLVKTIPFIRTTLSYVAPITGLFIAVYGGSIREEKSIVVPIFRSLIMNNKLTADISELRTFPKTTLYFLDVSGTMENELANKSWQNSVLNDLLNDKWQYEADSEYINKINVLLNKKQFSLLETAAIRLCREIMSRYQNLKDDERENTNFGVYAFGKILIKYAEPRNFQIENVQKALHNIIDKIGSNDAGKDKTNFVTVFNKIDEFCNKTAHQSIYTINDVNATIISDFNHDTQNINEDTAQLFSLLDTLARKEIRLNLINSPLAQNNKTGFNILNKLSSIFENYTFEKYQVNDNSYIISSFKSKNSIRFLYNKAKLTRSYCTISDNRCTNEELFVKLNGTTTKYNEYFFEINKKMIPWNGITTKIKFNATETVRYDGSAHTNPPGHSIVITNTRLGTSVEYDVEFAESFLRLKALTLLVLLAISGALSALYWHIHLKIVKQNS